MISHKQGIYLFCMTLCFHLNAQSQNEGIQKIIDSATLRFGICTVEYKKMQNGSQPSAWGSGFLLNRSYIATCYHVASAAGSPEISKIYLLSFQKDKHTGQIKQDSIDVNLNYRPTISQYNFLKHHYDPKDFKTDFVLYKLKKNVPYYQLRFSDESLKPGDTLLTIAPLVSENGRQKSLQLTAPSIIFQFYNPDQSGLPFIVFTCDVQEGSSGSLLYNTKGQIVAMIQAGWKAYPQFIDTLHQQGKISDKIYSRIKSAYNHGRHLGSAIPIQYLNEKYMKGYLE